MDIILRKNDFFESKIEPREKNLKSWMFDHIYVVQTAKNAIPSYRIDFWSFWKRFQHFIMKNLCSKFYFLWIQCNMSISRSDMNIWQRLQKITILGAKFLIFGHKNINLSKFKGFRTVWQSLSEIYFSIKKNKILAEFPHLSSLCPP